jgi:hypothetical protein
MAFPRGGWVEPGQEAKAFSGPKRAPQSSLAIVSEGVLKRFTLVMVAVCAVGLLAGCNRSSVISIPPPPPPHLYTGNFTANSIVTYAQPITPASVPALTVTAAQLGVTQINGVGSDSAGHFYFVDQVTSTIYRFVSPMTATSTVAANATTIGPPIGVGNILRFGFDPQGNLWASDSSNNQVYEWKPPFGAAQNFTITAAVPALSDPLEPVFDNAGHMFITSFFTAALEVFAFPTLTPTPTASAVITTCANPVDNAIDVLHQVYVSCNSDPGDIQVFTPPFGTGNTPAFTIASPFDHTLGHPLIAGQALRFDASGNLYASFTAPANTLAVYAPPFGGGTTPLFTFTTGNVISMAFAN